MDAVIETASAAAGQARDRRTGAPLSTSANHAGSSMEIEEREIAVAALRPGMYVCRLDRPWGETPFPLQGFLLADKDQIDVLQTLCSSVFVDLLRGIAPDSTSRMRRTESIEALRGTVAHVDRHSVEVELPYAKEAHENAVMAIGRIMASVRSGEALTEQAVDSAVTPVVASVMRNRDAFFWFETLRKRDSYSYGHAVSCCALAVAFGRHLGLPQDVLSDLSAGALLMDIGKAELPDDLLETTAPLESHEVELMRSHLDHSLRILDRSEIRSDDIRSVVGSHHERDDGSGYPEGLSGGQIPLLARIAGMVDSFDAMTNARPYRKALPAHVALQKLYAERDKLFQGELVEQFLQCMCVYPVGSLVELDSGEVAVVMAQNQSRRLSPRVVILTTPDKTFDPALPVVDLLVRSMSAANGQATRIVRALEPGAYGLDVGNLYL